MLLRIARASALINPEISPFSSDSNGEKNQSVRKFQIQIPEMKFDSEIMYRICIVRT